MKNDDPVFVLRSFISFRKLRIDRVETLLTVESKRTFACVF